MSILTDLFDAQLAVLKADFAADLVPVLQQKNNLIASNPTVLNLVAQAQAIVVDSEAELPKVEQDEIKALAAWVNTQLQVLANPPPARAPAPAAAK